MQRPEPYIEYVKYTLTKIIRNLRKDFNDLKISTKTKFTCLEEKNLCLTKEKLRIKASLTTQEDLATTQEDLAIAQEDLATTLEDLAIAQKVLATTKEGVDVELYGFVVVDSYEF